MERLQKYLANAGIASRRKCEELILEGKVKVNGQIVRELGFKIDPETDLVEFEGAKVEKREKKIVLIMNKPKEIISSVTDPQGRKTVLDLLPDKFPRLYPVGRLDYESEGMLILTNDGYLADKIMHPKNEIKKIYHVWVYGYPSQESLEKFSQGLELEDGKTAPAKIKLIRKARSTSLMEVEIQEGKKRQIRRMFEELGHPVAKLERIQIGHLTMGKLAQGKFKRLNEDDINKLLMIKAPFRADKRKFKR